MMVYIDSRESMETIEQFRQKAPKDAKLQVAALTTFDIATELVGVELKNVDDFISSVINISERKTRDDYQRMKEQFERMCDDLKPVKILLIHGTYEEAHSKLHEHSFNGMIASYTMKGLLSKPPVLVHTISNDHDWIDYTIRLVNKAHKYIEHPNQSKLAIEV